MSTAILQAEVQLRIDALTHPTAADVLLQNASDTVGLDLDLTNIIAVHNSATAAITGATPANDLTALNSASIALGITTRPSSGGGGGSPSVIGDLRPMYVNNTNGLHINAAGEHWLETGNIASAIDYPDAKSTPASGGGVYDNRTESGGSNGTSDMCFDGEFYYSVDGSVGRIRKYDSAWNLIANVLVSGIVTGGVVTIGFDGTFLWIGGGAYNYYKYNTDLVYQSESEDISATVSETVYGITFGGGFIWVIERYSGKALKFNLDWSYTGTYLDTSVETSECRLIFWDGFFLYVNDYPTNTVFQYDIDTGYTGVSFSTAGEASMQGATWDGSHIVTCQWGATFYWYTGYAPFVGIPTAEVDNSTGQPISVRIK